MPSVVLGIGDDAALLRVRADEDVVVTTDALVEGVYVGGEAGAFVLDGQIRPGGRLPVNTAGGMLSEAYIHGVNLMTEAVRQLRGTSTTPVPGARTCLVTGGLGATPTSAAILAV